MEESTTPETPSLSFKVFRQFVVSPDRYYEVELRNKTLHFARSGSQFDLAHPGSVGRNKMKTDDEAPSYISWFGSKATRGRLISAGIGIIVVSGVLIAINLAVGRRLFRPLFLAFVFGFVVLMAGFVTPTKAQRMSKSQDFRIPLSKIKVATLHIPENENQVARLELQPLYEKVIKLTINTHEDLKIVRESFLPMLGKKGKIL